MMTIGTAVALALPLLVPVQVPADGATAPEKAPANIEQVGDAARAADEQARGETRKARAARRKARQEARKKRMEARRERRAQESAAEASDADEKTRLVARKARWEARRARASARSKRAKARIQDIPRARRTDARRELRTHLQRMAKLDRIRELATEVGDPETVQRAATLMSKEEARHDLRMKVFESAPSPALGGRARPDPERPGGKSK